jgi:hypothetical protein
MLLLQAHSIRSKSEDWFGQSQDNESKMELHFYQWTCLSELAQLKSHLSFSFRHDIQNVSVAEKLLTWC